MATWRRAGRAREATAEFKKEEDCAKSWRDDEPDNPAARERLAEAYNWLTGDGAGAFGAGRREDYNDRLFALAEPWAKADPGSLPARFYLAAALHNRGLVRVAGGDPVAARDCFLQSKALTDGLIAERPEALDYQHAVQAVRRALAAVNVELGEPGAARPYATAEAEACRRAAGVRLQRPEQCGISGLLRRGVPHARRGPYQADAARGGGEGNDGRGGAVSGGPAASRLRGGGPSG